MGREIYPALSGGLRSMRSMDVLANNLANARTTGFKADRVQFELVTTESDADTKLGASFVAPMGEVTDYRQGPIEDTGRSTDLALRGEGFFVLAAQDGEEGPSLTRDGSFAVDRDGYLVSAHGRRVLGEGGEGLKVGTAGPFEVSETGEVTAQGRKVGSLSIVDVAARQELAKVGGNRWEAGDLELLPVDAQVRQGALEGSNVEPVQALTELIAVTRYFEAFQKNLDVSSKLDEQLSSSVGRLDR